MARLFDMYDAIEIIGGLIGGCSICIGLVVIFAMGLLNHQDLIQIIHNDTRKIMLVAICGIAFTVIVIAISKFMRTLKILSGYNERWLNE